ncbi:MAG TPA: hypothetical protein VHZ56_10465, partial [Devosia sp.]|nr:hypothetical protein [Devosia sp.]
MAKKSPSTDDAATLAFSAVEDALKDSVFGGPAPGPAQPSAQPEPTFTPSRAANPRSDRARAADKIAAQSGSVANDDRFQGSRILYGLQSKSSQTPTLAATLIAVGWVIAIVLVAIVRDGREFGTGAFF